MRANEALDTIPTIFDAVINDAVWDKVMNAEALTHDELTDAIGTNEMELAMDAVTEVNDAVTIPTTFDPVTNDADWAVVMNIDAVTYDALAANDVEQAYDAVIPCDAE